MTESELLRIGGTLTLSSTPVNFKHEKEQRTTGRIDYEWYWTGIPAYKLNDVVAISWNDWAIIDEYAYVSYVGLNTGTFYTSKAATFTYPKNDTKVLGGGHKFLVGIENNYYYASNGIGAL